MLKRFELKLGRMRKPQKFIVCPRPTNVGDDYQLITIQSSMRTCRIDTQTGEANLSPNHQYSGSLVDSHKAQRIQIDMELVNELKEAVPQPGTEIGGGVIIG